MMQLALQLGQEGAELAAARANRVHADWSEKALVAWYDYARSHERFTAEDVRLSCADTVPPAPDNRAWGALPRVAIKQGIVKRIPAHMGGIAHAKSPLCHGTWVGVYESLIFCGSVAK